jgi:CRP-like cAMP-binding protein
MYLASDNSAEHASDGTGNNLLRALRPADLALLQPLLEEWQGEAGTVLFEPGETVQQVYFPCGPSMVSFLVVLENGQSVETALIGREGAVGGIVSQGRLPAYARAEVQFSGLFLRMESAALERAKLQSLTLRHLFARYADCMVAQIFQAVACNGAHTIEQRTAKWLQAAMIRTGEDEVPLTQEQLAAMLGVGRSYLSRVLRSLKQRRILGTKRGKICVLDKGSLGRLACRCDGSVKRHFEEVLTGVYPVEDEPTAQRTSEIIAAE